MRRSVVVALVMLLVAGTFIAGVAQEKPLRKVVFAVTTKDISVGHAAHSSLPVALGYWKEEGLDVSVTSVEGSVAGMQQLAAGNIQAVSLGPEEIVLGREKGIRIKGFYVQARETIFRLVVPADSEIQSVRDLKGKTVGVPSLASGSLPFTKALVASVSLDPERDVKFLATGVGAPGALALQQKKVDAFALWDTLQASMENGGLRLRRLDLPIVHEMLGQTLAASDDSLATSPDVLIGLARGIAKATVFGLANSEAAIRFDLQRVDKRDDKRFGIGSPAQWEKLRAIYKEQKLVQGTVPVADLYTPHLVDRINAFDAAAIVRQAKEYKL